jgi:hypothetical protein
MAVRHTAGGSAATHQPAPTQHCIMAQPSSCLARSGPQPAYLRSASRVVRLQLPSGLAMLHKPHP